MHYSVCFVNRASPSHLTSGNIGGATAIRLPTLAGEDNRGEAA
ncbi:hypothetical protein JYK04_02236 [Streptomyces nojiriensis]|nr:hypothetical protein JYK04_02236 [Streptomyces nojiriensis]